MKIPSYIRQKYPVLLVAGLGGLFTVVNLAFAQTWTPTGGSAQGQDRRWTSVASSADGIKLVAGQGTCYFCNYPLPIYTSADSGMTWTRTSAPSNYWSSVASSADGTKLVAVVEQFFDINAGRQIGGSIYTSLDSGVTWTQTSAPAQQWASVASSADGTKLVAVASDDGSVFGGSIYSSPDSGATWTQTSAPNEYWAAVASSADGSKVVAVASLDANIYTLQFPIPPPPLQPSPRLSISRSAGSLGVSWLVPSTRFVLEQSFDLGSMNWTDVTTPPSLNFTNLNYQVTVSPSLRSSFYRLQQQ